MPEKTWIERATLALDMVNNNCTQDDLVLMYEVNISEAAQVHIEAAKVMMLIALVEELRKTNALLAIMGKR